MKTWKKGAIGGLLLMLISFIFGIILPIQQLKRIFFLIGAFPLIIIYYTTGYSGSGTDIPIITPLILISFWALVGAMMADAIEKYKQKQDRK